MLDIILSIWISGGVAQKNSLDNTWVRIPGSTCKQQTTVGIVQTNNTDNNDDNQGRMMKKKKTSTSMLHLTFVCRL